MRMISIFAIALLTGCSIISKQPPPIQPEPIIKTVTEFKTLDIYQPPLPSPISLEDVKFFVITEKNMEEKIKELERLQGGKFVLFGLTPQAYENMAYNLQEIRRYIQQQKEIILYYRKATLNNEDWLQRNQKEIEKQQSPD